MDDNIFFWEKLSGVDLNTCQQGVEFILNKRLLSRKDNPNKSKKFFDEVAPITFLATFLSAKSIRFTNDNNENLSYDAILNFCDRKKQQKVECTKACNDYKEAIMMEHLDKYGFASINQPVNYTGTKRKRKIQKQSEMFCFTSAEDRYNEIYKRILSAIEKKKLKNKEDYVDSILLVVVDTTGGRIEKLKENIIDKLKKQQISKSPFSRVFLICSNPPEYSSFFWEIL